MCSVTKDEIDEHFDGTSAEIQYLVKAHKGPTILATYLACGTAKDLVNPTDFALSVFDYLFRYQLTGEERRQMTKLFIGLLPRIGETNRESRNSWDNLITGVKDYIACGGYRPEAVPALRACVKAINVYMRSKAAAEQFIEAEPLHPVFRKEAARSAYSGKLAF